MVELRSVLVLLCRRRLRRLRLLRRLRPRRLVDFFRGLLNI